MSTNIEELKIKLESDKQELQELELLLEEDPQNEELHSLKADLINVIKVASDQIVNLQTASTTTISSFTSPPLDQNIINQKQILQQQQQQQQILNNSSSSGSSILAIGSRCEGKYAVDGVWYAGVITDIKSDGTYVILYDGYGNSETLSFADIRPLTRVKLGSSVKDQSTRVNAASDGYATVPKHLRINVDDSEETKKLKLKKQHSIKSANRVYRIDEENRQQKQKWQDFVNENKKSGKTLTDRGLKKGSIFSTPDNLNGRVGVVGSGKAMTEGTQFSTKRKSITK
ncbi:putative splicing factor [Cavenderia fasciculata]|uniref:Survival of motor neuron-related-splicing factor 30 n=1 Tax=Cavenderia fasciculata TaxID=261658 RepID=F4PVD0_CACFS|nr:putative splicing factor [Cavenderia fasciculata]EGG19944.1 putative splicing factor [Cavenderia fasciculata]|eukprot:XP_004366927.1 putative splicing factor [Cavenderia fasciculata]